MTKISPVARIDRWRPSPFAGASLAGHAAALGMLALRPSVWPWLLGGVVADHAVLIAGGLWPRSSLLGPNWTRLPAAAAARREVAVTIDDGPDPEVTPRVLEILAQRRTCATFFCIGERVAAHPALAREIIRAGHAIENHSQRHLHRFAALGPSAIRREIAEAQRVITDVTGETPRFFRAPAGLRNPFLDPVLSGLGLRLTTWTRRGFDTVAQRADLVLARLARRLGAGDIVLLHDGHAARTLASRPVIVEVLPRLLETIEAAGLRPITLRDALQ